MKVRMQSVLLMLITLAFVFAGQAQAADHGMHGKDKAADEVMVSDAFARAVAPMQKNSAVFMSLMNHGKMEHAIVRASGDVAQSVELHTHTNDGGVMRMRPIEKIAIPAGGHTQLKPGGLHIMLIGLNNQLEEGGMVHITLEFEDGSTKMVMAPVKQVTPMNHNNGGHNMDDMKEHKHNM